MARRGGLSHSIYSETRGMKVSGGNFVKSGTLLTREGHRWKPGRNVIGLMHLTAACDGTVMFSRKRGNYKRQVTYIHIDPVSPKEKKSKKQA